MSINKPGNTPEILSPGYSEIVAEETMDTPLLAEVETGHFAAGTSMGIDYKTWNEDTVIVSHYKDRKKNLHTRLVVGDGMGGTGGVGDGQKAAQEFAEEVKTSKRGQKWKTIIQKVWERIAKNTTLAQGAGLAFCGVDIQGDKAEWAHLGDVKGIHVSADGTVKLETKDHTLADTVGEMRGLSRQEVLNHSQKNILTKCIQRGDDLDFDVDEDIDHTELEEGDVLLIASDFLWDNCDVDEVLQLIWGKTPEEAVHVLNQAVQDRVKGFSSKIWKIRDSKPDNQGITIYIHGSEQKILSGLRKAPPVVIEDEITLEDGSRFKGMIENGELDEGRLEDKLGNMFEGIFANNAPAQGDMIAADGTLFKNFIWSQSGNPVGFGEGEVTRTDGVRIEGYVTDELQAHGKANVFYPKNNLYSDASLEDVIMIKGGIFNEGEPVSGTITFADGSMLRNAQWSQDKNDPYVIGDYVTADGQKTIKNTTYIAGLAGTTKEELESGIQRHKKAVQQAGQHFMTPEQIAVMEQDRFYKRWIPEYDRYGVDDLRRYVSQHAGFAIGGLGFLAVATATGMAAGVMYGKAVDKMAEDRVALGPIPDRYTPFEEVEEETPLVGAGDAPKLPTVEVESEVVIAEGGPKVPKETFAGAGEAPKFKAPTDGSAPAENLGGFTPPVPIEEGAVIPAADAVAKIAGAGEAPQAESKVEPVFIDTDGDGLDDKIELVLGTDPLNPDSDGDRMSDGEEVGLATNPMKQDTDGDGIIDGEEFLLGSDPLDSDSDADGLSDGEDEDPLQGEIEPDEWEDDPEWESLIVTEEDLTEMSENPSVDGGIDPNEEEEILEEVAVEREPYIYGPMLPKDTDLDGISDMQEIIDGTSYYLADSDGDILTDSEEKEAGTDPNLMDTDGDHINDFTEVKLTGTDPLKRDTDGDGLSDLSELRIYHTDPLDPESYFVKEEEVAVVIPPKPKAPAEQVAKAKDVEETVETVKEGTAEVLAKAPVERLTIHEEELSEKAPTAHRTYLELVYELKYQKQNENPDLAALQAVISKAEHFINLDDRSKAEHKYDKMISIMAESARQHIEVQTYGTDK